MTKMVRIENADTSYEKIVEVEVWENGHYVRTETLSVPSQLQNYTLWAGLELRVREIPNPNTKRVEAYKEFVVKS